MRRLVPPIATALIPLKAWTARGSTAITAKKTAPNIVILNRMLPIWVEVDAPGRTPGIKAPLLCKFFDIESGSNVIAV